MPYTPKQTDWNNSQYHREIRSTSPNADDLRRPAGWIVVVCGDSTDEANMYVSLGDGTWQKVFAGTGTIGT